MKRMIGLLILMATLAFYFVSFAEGDNENLPFFVDVSSVHITPSGVLTDFFSAEKKLEIRKDEDAIEYHLSESGFLGNTVHVVYTDGIRTILRIKRHIILCEAYNDSTTLAKELIKDLMPNEYSSFDQEAYYFENQNFYVLYDDYGTKRAICYNRQSGEAYSTNVIDYCFSDDQSAFAMLGRNSTFLYLNRKKGIEIVMNLSEFIDSLDEIVYISPDDGVIVRSTEGNKSVYYYINANSCEVYSTSIPNNTVFVSDETIIINEEYKLLMKTTDWNGTFVKKKDYSSLQSSSVVYKQYGKVLTWPYMACYISGKMAQTSKELQSLTGYLNKIKRLTVVNGVINKYYNSVYDKTSGKIISLKTIPQSFQSSNELLMSDWEACSSNQFIICTPIQSLSNNLEHLMTTGFFAYDVDRNSSSCIRVILSEKNASIIPEIRVEKAPQVEIPDWNSSKNVETTNNNKTEQTTSNSAQQNTTSEKNKQQKNVAIKSATDSIHLKAFPAKMMLDKKENTCWQYSAKKTKNGTAYAEFKLKKASTVDVLWIKNGFWKQSGGKDSYVRNGRPKTIQLSFRYSGQKQYKDETTITIPDDGRKSGWKQIDIGRHEKVEAIKLTVIDYYKGSVYPDDVAITGIEFYYYQ